MTQITNKDVADNYFSIFDNLHLAEIVDNNDSDKKGRVQIRPLVIGSGWKSTDLPWARPMRLSSGGSNSFGISHIPENNAKVWVTYEKPKQFKNPFYIWDVDTQDINIHGKFDSDIKASITNMQSSYPDVKFQLYKNGICTFISSSSDNKELGFYHPAGTFVFIDNTGKLNVNTADDITIKSNSKKTRIENNSGYIELSATGQANLNGNLTVDP